MTETKVYLEYEPQLHPDLSGELRGPVADFFYCDDPEIMVHGPAGTAKSVFLSLRMLMDACRYPGSRQLIARESLKRVKQSWETATWRERILAPWEPLKTRFYRKTENRYIIPFADGRESVIEMGGLDDAQRYYSTEWDRVWINEAHDRHVTLDHYERFARSLRAFNMPVQQIWADMNPGPKTHWTYRRFTEPYEGGSPRATGFKFEHRHNPGYWDDVDKCWTEKGKAYLQSLRLTTSGVRYRRLYLGEWCGAEGAIYDLWDENLHVLDGDTKKVGGEWFLIVKDQEGCPGELVDGMRHIRLHWFAAGQDWGIRAPGSLTLFGFDDQCRAYLIEEIYQTGKNVNWWASQVLQLHRKYELVRVVADSADGSSVSVFNDFLGPRVDNRVLETDSVDVREQESRHSARIAIPCDKSPGESGQTSVMTGVNIMHHRMQRAVDGSPRLFVRKGCRRHPPDSALEGKPSGFLEEIGEYVWEPVDEARIQMKTEPERPIQLNNHSMDSARYLLRWAHKRNYTHPAEQSKWGGTWGEYIEKYGAKS